MIITCNTDYRFSGPGAMLLYIDIIIYLASRCYGVLEVVTFRHSDPPDTGMHHINHLTLDQFRLVNFLPPKSHRSKRLWPITDNNDKQFFDHRNALPLVHHGQRSHHYRIHNTHAYNTNMTLYLDARAAA